MTVDDLIRMGLPLGDARLFKEESDSLAHKTGSGSAPKTESGSAGKDTPSHVGGGAAAATTALSSMSLSPPSPPAASEERTFASSNFILLYEGDVTQHQHELFAGIHGFIKAMCRRFGVPDAAGEDLFQRLQGESFENPHELLSQIQVAATRIWTSTQKLQGAGVDKALNVEFCSLVNRALRDDIADVMQHLVVIVRAINALCIVRRESKSLKFPPNSESHRGGALPPQHHAFFAVGKKYRVPMYLATSFSEDKAYEFWYPLGALIPSIPRFPAAHRLPPSPHSGTARFIQSKCRCTGSYTLTRAGSTRCATAART
jgi:hypothetical protein